MVLIPSRWTGLWVNADRVAADEGGLADAYDADVYGINELVDVEYALDIGAHVGGASALLRQRFPHARIVAVECCPENIPALRANVGSFAEVIQAAVSYEPGELMLASTVYEDCRTSGSSVVTTREAWNAGDVPWTWYRHDYHLDDRAMDKVTIEELMGGCDLPRIDFVKMDCEGSEISILENCACLDKIRLIAGEYHSVDALRSIERLKDGTLTTWDGHLFRFVRG